jgi:TPR repeat protein
MSYKDDMKDALDSALRDHEMRAQRAREDAARQANQAELDAFYTRQIHYDIQRISEHMQNGDYPEVVKIEKKKANISNQSVADSHMPEALWKWGNVCEQGTEKYPKDEAKALELYKVAAWYGNKDAQQRLKQRGIKFKVPKKDREVLSTFICVAAGLGLSFLVSNLLNLQMVAFLLRWLIRIVAFFIGGFTVPLFYLNDEAYWYVDYSMESPRLKLVKNHWKRLLPLFIVWLAAALYGWAGLVLPSILRVSPYIRTIPGIVAYYKVQAKKQSAVVDLDAPSENGAAKIFRINYGENETVISIIRTTGSHKAVSIAKPGEANSFYVKDNSTGETYPLKETRPQDYEAAAGVELVFEPFKSRVFDLIEGKDTTATA